MLKIYLLLSAVITLLLDIPFEIFKQTYSWWLVPVLLIGAFVALVLLHCIVLLVSVLVVNLDKPPKDTDFFRLLVKTFLKMALPILRVKVHTTGLEKIPEDEPFLIVSNHTHNLDPAIIYYAVPDARIAFIAKKEVRDLYPFVYKALHKLNGLPIDRENNREAAKVIINATKLIKEKTNSVAVFPEGYVSKTGELLPIRSGSLKIATKAKAKIVVCTTWGTKQVPKNLFRRRTDIYFDVLDVIDTAENQQTVELGEKIGEIMLESLITKEGYPTKTQEESIDFQ
ncbi:MAG: 1-acyl-sn-glycerol-3-phosphate acyltransferase [Clostridia bacterium]|nr:1-acyl-sn-glycerol-3-phosphate acyltransferase [Clostridia bacterium]